MSWVNKVIMGKTDEWLESLFNTAGINDYYYSKFICKNKYEILYKDVFNEYSNFSIYFWILRNNKTQKYHLATFSKEFEQSDIMNSDSLIDCFDYITQESEKYHIDEIWQNSMDFFCQNFPWEKLDKSIRYKFKPTIQNVINYGKKLEKLITDQTKLPNVISPLIILYIFN
jgi:hypothetical protein